MGARAPVPVRRERGGGVDERAGAVHDGGGPRQGRDLRAEPHEEARDPGAGRGRLRADHPPARRDGAPAHQRGAPPQVTRVCAVSTLSLKTIILELIYTNH